MSKKRRHFLTSTSNTSEEFPSNSAGARNKSGSSDLNGAQHRESETDRRGSGVIADSEDLSFRWLVRDHGPAWEEWRQLLEQYVQAQDSGLSQRLFALRQFCLRYLLAMQLPPSPDWFLSRDTPTSEHNGITGRRHLPDVYSAIKRGKNQNSNVKLNNYISEFIDWALLEHYSEPDDYGRPVLSPAFRNPVPRLKRERQAVLAESVRAALPYAYLARLQEMLAPGNYFSDWKWAHSALGLALEDGGVRTRTGGSLGDWFEVSPNLIDRSDPDCVWRERTVGERRDSSTGKVVHRNLVVTELWSPARSVALLTKLMLPLRSSQVRWLDSGEADTWRYQTSGRDGPNRAPRKPGETQHVDWAPNAGRLATGSERHPVARGVFRRIEDYAYKTLSTGFYVNTNKTADAEQTGEQKGYVIPWQKDDLLYWLEKLRNWQEKYNPIAAPVAWSTLGIRHLRHIKSRAALARYPDTCFLFRDAAGVGADRARPITDSSMEWLWYPLLEKLERDEAERGSTFEDGQPIKFVKPIPENANHRTTLFPLHSLRVSLLTCLALDGEVPLPVLSKLVAGHSRLIMTIYYQKVTPYRVSELLAEAQQRIREGSQESVRRFLAEESFHTLAQRLVVLDQATFKSALGEEPGDRVPAGWMPLPLGWCLAGGNTSPGEANAKLPGCYNGGPQAKHANKGIFGPVHGGPRNCVSCRWLVTSPQYLPALCARANEVALQLSDNAQVLIDLEEQATNLRRDAYRAESQGDVWLRAHELSDLVARAERQASIVDSLGTTLAYAWRLIVRCLKVGGSERTGSLVAAGRSSDVQVALREVDSRMLQIHQICMDSEIQPDIDPGGALFVRSQWIDAALQRDGHKPLMFTLSKDQQLHVGNRLLDDLGEHLDPDCPTVGREKVLLAMERGESLAQLGLYSATASCRELAAADVMRLGDYVQVANSPRLPAPATTEQT